MLLKFKDILREDLVEANVIMVFGDKPLFNNMVIDECRRKCENIHSMIDNEVIGEFGTEYKNRPSINKVEYKEFMSVCYMPSVAGTWYCKVRLSELSEKELDWLRKYIKNTSNYAKLVIEETEYKNYYKWLRNRLIEYSKNVHIIQLSFTTNKELMTIVDKMFRNRRVMLSEESVRFFIRRMGGRYDLYADTIRELTPCADNENCIVQKWEVDTIKGLMVNIQHYSIDMLLAEIIKGTHSRKLNSNVRIIKLLKYLEDEYGSNTLVSKLNKEIEILIRFRLWINEGKIPVGMKFPLEEVKDKLDKNMNKHVFKNRVIMASRMSIEELVFIKSVIERYYARSEQCLFIIAIRKSLTGNEIHNIMEGVANV